MGGGGRRGGGGEGLRKRRNEREEGMREGSSGKGEDRWTRKGQRRKGKQGKEGEVSAVKNGLAY